MVLDSGDVVVALDGSEASEAAIPVALQLAQALEAPLRFVHILDAEATESGVVSPDDRQRFRDYVRTTLARSNSETPFDVDLRVGQPAAELLDLARTARVFVMATHGRGGLRAAVIGSVTDKVVRACPVPVLAVPVETKSSVAFGPILVALDGSDRAERGLELARALAGRLKTTVALIQSYSLPPAASVEFAAFDYRTIDMLEQAAQEYLGSVALPGEQKIAPMMTPTAAVTQAAEDIDAGLVVMTSHGKGFFKRVTLGSTTNGVLHSLKRPLLIVPAGADE